MKVETGKAATVAAVIWMSFAAGTAAQQIPTAPTQPPSSAAPQAESAAAQSQRTILISLPDHKLAVLESGQVKAIYTVAVGKPSTPSPVGYFTIVSRIANPTYSHAGRVVGPGPHNPVGTRWMGLNQKGYGIHGTNVPNSIGKSASHGCIRVGQKDLEQLFRMVQVGDAVDIRDQRDAQVAAVFDSQPMQPEVSAAAVLVAQTVAPIPAPAVTQTATHGGE